MDVLVTVKQLVYIQFHIYFIKQILNFQEQFFYRIYFKISWSKLVQRLKS